MGPIGPNRAHGPGIWARGPKLWAQFRARMVGPTSGPNLGIRFWGSNSPSLPFGKYPIPRAREAHIQVRRPLLCRRVLKPARSATKLNLPRTDIVFFLPNHPNLGGGIFGILGLGMAWPGSGMAWPGLGMAWPGLGLAWPGLGMAWPGLGMAWPGLGMAWPWLGMAWPGWVWRDLAGYTSRAMKNLKIWREAIPRVL